MHLDLLWLAMRPSVNVVDLLTRGKLRCMSHVGQGRISEVEGLRQEYDVSRKEVRRYAGICECRPLTSVVEEPQLSSKT